MPRFNDPYAPLADVYDSFASDRDLQAFYGKWRNSVLEAVRRYKVKVRVLVDLACGTGNATIPWTVRCGWKVIGVDRSAAMLRQARKKSNRVRWIRQDLRKLNLDVRADVATCHFDALDHILDPRDLQQVFVNVARMLNDGGLFQFDMNTEHIFRWLNGREKLFSPGRNYFMASNEYDAGSRIVTFHQLWFIPRGRLYEKRKIRVQERAYAPAEIRRLLEKAGLRLLKTKVQLRIEGRPARMLYLAGKPKTGSHASWTSEGPAG